MTETPDAPMSDVGEQLLADVHAYASIGCHRTGTDGDAATRAWVRERLEALGGRTRELPYAFPRFTATHHRVTVDGVAVESEPLWYAGEGRVDTTDVDRLAADVTRVAIGGDGSRQASVVATTHADGLLTMPNRPPSSSVPRPVALVAGVHAEALTDAPVRVEAELVRSIGTSANVAARFGRADRSPVVVTTPLSGWFTCAGERGTGIAVAIELTARLAEHHPVLFLGTTGHEIGYLGVRDLVGAGVCDGAVAVVHVGASVGAGVEGPGGLDFGPDRHVFTTVSGDAAAPLRDAVAVGAYANVVTDPPSWLGEGEVLKQTGLPMLSFLGLFPLFHTPQDVPERSTSPTLLASAMAAVDGGVTALLDHVATPR